MPKKFVTRKKDVPVAIPGSTDDSSDGGSRTRDVGWPSLTEADLENPAKFAEASVMMSLGLVLFVGGLAYRGLPFDLIPD